MGISGRNYRQHLDPQMGSMIEQLDQVAKLYKSFLNNNGGQYLKFITLYKKNKELLSKIESERNADIGESAKAELVLADEGDVRNRLESANANMREMSELADKVLNESKWPDLNEYRERLNKLTTITPNQLSQSKSLDERTGELIEMYNNIISTFKKNMYEWDKRLESYENRDRDEDADV